MGKPIGDLEDQKQRILDEIPMWFYDSLGPYEFPLFQHTFAEVKSIKLGRMEVAVMEISIAEYSLDELILPDQLLMTIWPDVTCNWDPKEVRSADSKSHIKSLSFEIEPSIDFDTVEVNTEEDTFEIWDSLAEFITDKIIDRCMYELEKDEGEITRLIDKQPPNLRRTIREKCHREVEKIKKRHNSNRQS